MKRSFRVLITEKCNANCPNCFNANYRIENEMSVEKFEKLSKYLSEHGIKTLKIMGGEPTVHTEFENIVLIAQRYFNSIIIFTNAVNERIKNIKLRETDSITYNFTFINYNFDITKLLLEQPGKRSIEVQISSDSDEKNILDRMKWLNEVCDFSDKVQYNLTLNCIENIFLKEDIIVKKWNSVVDYIENDLNMDYNVDHNIPKCFSSQMKLNKPCKLCSVECSGLIDTDLYLRYCNQMPKRIIKLLNNNEFVDYNIVISNLNNNFEEKINNNYEKKCYKCMNFKNTCNGGCFVHKY